MGELKDALLLQQGHVLNWPARSYGLQDAYETICADPVKYRATIDSRDIHAYVREDQATIAELAKTIQPDVQENKVPGADLSERINDSEAFLAKCEKLDFGQTVGSNEPASEILKEAWRDAVKDIILLHQGYGFPYVDFSERLLRTYASIYEDETIRGKMDPDKISEYVAEDLVSITALASTIQSKIPVNTVSGGVLAHSISEIMNGGGSPNR